MERNVALKILDEVSANYNKVADDFSRTRKSVWEEFKPLAEYVKDGDNVLDLGCGNGRLTELFQGRNVRYSGIDNSEKLIEIAFKKNPDANFKVFDGLKIPYPDNYFDVIFCIAVLHHIPGKQLRQEFLGEVRRVLKPGSKLIITVFYLWQKETYWLLILKQIFKKILGMSKLDFFDVIETWFGSGKRYFHVFRRSEFKSLVKKGGFQIERFSVIIRRKGNKNLLIVAKK